jgi:hypothetical protein
MVGDKIMVAALSEALVSASRVPCVHLIPSSRSFFWIFEIDLSLEVSQSQGGPPRATSSENRAMPDLGINRIGYGCCHDQRAQRI